MEGLHGLDSIKTPAASSKSTLPGQRAVINLLGDSEDEDGDEDDVSRGHNRLVGAANGSPEITFDSRHAGKLKLPGKTFTSNRDTNSLLGAIQKKPLAKKPPVTHNHALLNRRASVTEDQFKGSIDPNSGVVKIVRQYAAESESEAEEDNYSDNDDDEGFTWT